MTEVQVCKHNSEQLIEYEVSSIYCMLVVSNWYMYTCLYKTFKLNEFIQGMTSQMVLETSTWV